MHGGFRDRLLLWLVAHIPTPVLVAPERVLIQVAVIVIGLTGVTVARPGSLVDLLPTWLVYEWAATLLIGGVASMAGHWRGHRRLDRMGSWLLIIGASTYAVGVLLTGGLRATTAAVIYLGIAGAAATRLLVGSAAWAKVRSGPRGRA